jgi:FkbM family methyltransferase
MQVKALKGAIKSFRASQPFNAVATAAVRGLLKAVGLRSEWVIRHLHRVGMVKVRLPNGRLLRLWSLGDDWVSNQIFWRGWNGYEPETAGLFFHLAQRAAVALDIGAHVGFFTLLAAHANPQGKVLAFEPLIPVRLRLQKNITLNELTNVVCVDAAVGDTDGIANFFHVPSGLPSSSSLSPEFMRGVGPLVSSPVPVVRLDGLLKERGIERVDLLKIDTESTEPRVLAGAKEMLRRDMPPIICEVLRGRGAERALDELLVPLGYRFYLLTPNGPQPKDHVEGHPQWLNYLFTPLGLQAVQELFELANQIAPAG